MGYRRALCVTLVTGALALPASVACASAQGTRASAQGGVAGWRVVPSATVTCASAVSRQDAHAAVLDVAATGASDAWAVGVCGADGGTHDNIGQTPAGFVEHWNGHRWSVVRVPASGEYDVVRAVSPWDVWVASVAGDPWAAAQTGSAHAMPGGANVVHWDGKTWSVAQHGLGTSDAVYALSATSAGSVWALAYPGSGSGSGGGSGRGTVVLHWSGGRWQPVAGPAGFAFATRPLPPGHDPGGGGFLRTSTAGGGAVWVGGESAGSAPVIARRTGSGWTTVPVPITSTAGWIEDMIVSGHDVWVEVVQAGSGAGGGSQTVLERYDGNGWTVMSTAPVPGTVDWAAAEINAGQNYGGYLLCRFTLTGAQRAEWYGFAWTCPALRGVGITALTAVPGKRRILWAAGARNPGGAMRPVTAVFGGS